MSAQLGVDPRNDNACACEAEPDRQIFGPIRHHQADGFVFGQSLIERPMRVPIGAFDKRPIGQAFAADRDQRRRIALRVRKFGDHVIEQALRTGCDRRRAFECPDPVAQRAVFGSHDRPRRFRFDSLHQIIFTPLHGRRLVTCNSDRSTIASGVAEKFGIAMYQDLDAFLSKTTEFT
jgi:hypothetical protein